MRVLQVSKQRNPEYNTALLSWAVVTWSRPYIEHYCQASGGAKWMDDTTKGPLMLCVCTRGRRGGKKKRDLAANSINPHDGNRLCYERPMLLRHATRPFCWAYKCFSNAEIDVGWFPVKGTGEVNVWLWECRCRLRVATCSLGTMASNHGIVTYGYRVAAEAQILHLSRLYSP